MRARGGGGDEGCSGGEGEGDQEAEPARPPAGEEPEAEGRVAEDRAEVGGRRCGWMCAGCGQFGSRGF